MTHKSILVLVLVLALAGLAPAPATAESALDIEVRLVPTDEYEGGYRCSAVVRDAGSGEVLSAPTITFLRGQEGETVSEVPGHGLLRFNVAVSADGAEASYRAELVVEDRVVAAQRASIRL